jgi:predicted DNA-binding transcriptional regulator AlpA
MPNRSVVAESLQGRTIDELPEILSRPQLAEFSGVATQTLARWAMDKTGPKVTHLGRRVVYRKRDVLTWLDEGAD